MLASGAATESSLDCLISSPPPPIGAGAGGERRARKCLFLSSLFLSLSHTLSLRFSAHIFSSDHTHTLSLPRLLSLTHSHTLTRTHTLSPPPTGASAGGERRAGKRNAPHVFQAHLFLVGIHHTYDLISTGIHYKYDF